MGLLSSKRVFDGPQQMSSAFVFPLPGYVSRSLAQIQTLRHAATGSTGVDFSFDLTGRILYEQ